jgi:hypothetical protein
MERSSGNQNCSWEEYNYPRSGIGSLDRAISFEVSGGCASH